MEFRVRLAGFSPCEYDIYQVYFQNIIRTTLDVDVIMVVDNSPVDLEICLYAAVAKSHSRKRVVLVGEPVKVIGQTVHSFRIGSLAGGQRYDGYVISGCVPGENFWPYGAWCNPGIGSPEDITRERNVRVKLPKTRFCSVVRFSSDNTVRNTLIEMLGKYKTIDSAGKWNNNMPNGWTVPGIHNSNSIRKFFSSGKFVLTCENSQMDEYITEKLMNGFRSGSIPIYWGSPIINTIFNPKAFINVSDYASLDEVVERIKYLDTHDDEYQKVLNTSIWNDIIPEYMTDIPFRKIISKLYPNLMIEHPIVDQVIDPILAAIHNARNEKAPFAILGDSISSEVKEWLTSNLDKWDVYSGEVDYVKNIDVLDKLEVSEPNLSLVRVHKYDNIQAINPSVYNYVLAYNKPDIKSYIIYNYSAVVKTTSISEQTNKLIYGYMINLENRTDRWKRAQEIFKDSPVEIIRVDAVRASKPYYEGCFRSHQRAVRIAKDKKLPYILVLEDDCLLKPDFNERFPTILKWLQAHIDEWNFFNGGVTFMPNEVKYEKTIDEGLGLVKLNYGAAGHFVIYNSSVYDWILSRSLIQPLDMHICHTYPQYTAIPYIATQFHSYSDNIRSDNPNLTSFFENAERAIINKMKGNK
jgi:hypothetical protein